MRASRSKPWLRPFLKHLQMAEYWLVAQAVKASIALLRLLPMDAALAFAGGTARRLGPLFGRHRVALHNLRLAFPEKSEAEIRMIALDMWGHMGRLAAEYIYLDRLFDFDPQNPTAGRIEGLGIDIFLRIAAEKGKPHIAFSGHLGNFELMPIVCQAFGLEGTVLFRPPNNPYIADYIYKTRNTKMGGLMSSRGAAIGLARILEDGGNVGMLVDQKFSQGIRTTFFGRPCETSPLLPKLARQFDCDVYPVRSQRLPGNRFRLELEEKLTLPRDEEGKVDIAATAQLLNDVVERWVRDDPAQWMWFHKRWTISVPWKRRARASAGPAAPDGQ